MCVMVCTCGLTCLEAAQPEDTFVRAIFPSKFEHLCRQSVDIRDEERALTTCQLRRQVCTNFPTLRLGIFERHSFSRALRYELHFVKCLQDLVHLSIKQLRRKVAWEERTICEIGLVCSPPRNTWRTRQATILPAAKAQIMLRSTARLRPVSQKGRRLCAEVLLCTLAATFHSGKKASSAHSLCEVNAVPGMWHRPGQHCWAAAGQLRQHQGGLHQPDHGQQLEEELGLGGHPRPWQQEGELWQWG